jgi:hypothetical protein
MVSCQKLVPHFPCTSCLSCREQQKLVALGILPGSETQKREYAWLSLQNKEHSILVRKPGCNGLPSMVLGAQGHSVETPTDLQGT